MGKNRLYRTEGIVLRRRDQGEADRVLTLCTPIGKLDAIAKGVRKVRSRKAGHVELFSRSSFVIASVPASWDIISQVETIQPHAVLRSDLLRGTYARYVIELLDRFLTEGEGGQATFELLDRALTWLCEDEDLDLVIRRYEMRILDLAGFRPELFYCVGNHENRVALCVTSVPQTSPNQPRYGFDLERGGALCPVCYETASRQGAPGMTGDVLRFLQESQKTPYSILRERAVPRSIHRAIEPILRRYICYHLESGINSLTFLNRLRQEMEPAVNQSAYQISR